MDSEHTADWCRMPDDPFTGRFQFTMDCPACDRRLQDEIDASIARNAATG